MSLFGPPLRRELYKVTFQPKTILWFSVSFLEDLERVVAVLQKTNNTPANQWTNQPSKPIKNTNPPKLQNGLSSWSMNIYWVSFKILLQHTGDHGSSESTVFGNKKLKVWKDSGSLFQDIFCLLPSFLLNHITVFQYSYFTCKHFLLAS